MEVKMYVTSETDRFAEKALFCNDEPVMGAHTVTASDTPSNTNFKGFGVAPTGSSCYMLSIMDPDMRKTYLNDVYGKNGLHLSVGRISIGSSDYSPELYSYCDEKDDLELKSFSIDRDRSYIIPMLHEIQKANPSINFFAAPWSPPGWMKTSGKMCGGYMRDRFVDCYADYFIAFLNAYKKEGIDIFAVTPQNEPETQQQGTMPACIWHPDTEVNFIKMLRKKLEHTDLDTKVWIYDHNFSGIPRIIKQLEENPELAKDATIAFHYYDGSPKAISELRKKFPLVKWNFTEGGPRLFDNYDTDWGKWGVAMSLSLENGCDSFCGWNLLLDNEGGPNIGPFFCGGLATYNPKDKTLNYSGQYHALRHFSGTIQSGARIYPITVSKEGICLSAFPNHPFELYGIAADNRDGSHVLQLVNVNNEKSQLQYLYNNKWWYVELMPNTIATIVFS